MGTYEHAFGVAFIGCHFVNLGIVHSRAADVVEQQLIAYHTVCGQSETVTSFFGVNATIGADDPIGLAVQFKGAGVGHIAVVEGVPAIGIGVGDRPRQATIA